MKALALTHDSRINASNFLLEVTIEEYLGLAGKALERNEYQRRRVKSASSVYALLKEDLLKGCIMPPIVLGLPLVKKASAITLKNICEVIQKTADNLLILDGLQRTYTLIDLRNELVSTKDENALKRLHSLPLRIEVYAGINRIGILYRMLTLNTGQTPMSLRQQIEMLYIDFAKIPIDGVKVIKEADDDAPQKLGEYTFRSVIEGFNAYLERNELPLDRFDILENIKSLEKLSTENQDATLFEDFVKTYDKFVKHFAMLTGEQAFDSDDLEISGQVFGKDARRVFTKSQAITGFGSAVGKLRDRKVISHFDDIVKGISKLKPNKDAKGALKNLLKTMEQIRLSSKKIGNSQRLYFHFFFRELFNPDGDSYLDLNEAVSNAYQKYLVQMS
ncbi:hypothetical protein CMV30_10320 [Nibricoccus aquaticus]|uniref:DUF262 domain-containing protein n=2 Tax=Nibricoccus aquaticus TaxID=2576891 RepID=A0A290Q7T1_9BACT|nr:hypothetical protein CMV30_10320 [Nibricoccus aquaticus]